MNAPVPLPAAPEQIEAFIARWQGREGGQERANLCAPHRVLTRQTTLV